MLDSDNPCHDCGRCCEYFTLPQPAFERKDLEPREREWLDHDVIPTPSPDVIPVDGYDWYTCRFYDPETKTCADYENRPGPCRSFPYHIMETGNKDGTMDNAKKWAEYYDCNLLRMLFVRRTEAKDWWYIPCPACEGKSAGSCRRCGNRGTVGSTVDRRKK